MKIPTHVKLVRWFVLCTFSLMSACSSTNYARKWQELPKNTRIEVITTSGEKFKFESWSIGIDSGFIGISDSTARFLPKEAIQGIYVSASDLDYVLSIVFAIVLLVEFLRSALDPWKGAP